MIIVKRQGFMLWTQGILMDRDREGNVVIGDDTKNEEAEKALERGEEIGLTINGRLVSTMKLEDGAFVEKLYSAPKVKTKKGKK